MTESKKYRAFISYSHQDEAWGRWLHKSLESWRTPRRLTRQDPAIPARLMPIFRDREEFASSADLGEVINRALTDSENLIVLCSPSAARSRWVNEEIVQFKKLGRSDRIFCLIVSGNPASAGASDDCFAPALRQRFDRNGEALGLEQEPVAADLRPGGDGKRLALLKILAGMLQVDLDSLRRREHQRRQRQLMLVISATTTVALITSGLAIDAILTRQEVEQRQQQAEDLLGFMVDDLRSSLAPLGRLDLLESVSDRARLYFATVDSDMLSDQELSRQAQVLTQIGQIDLERIDYESATEAFTEAYSRASALVESDPRNEQHLFNRGQAEFWVGYTNLEAGSLSQAEQWLERYLQTSLELVAIDPANDDWAQELGYAYHNLAVLAEGRGDLDGAEEGYRYLIEVLQDIQTRSYSSQREWDIASAVSFLGNIALGRGDLGLGHQHYTQSLEIARQIHEARPDDARFQEAYAWALVRVGRTESLLGRHDVALQHFQEAMQLFSNLLALDESNNDFDAAVASAQILLGKTLLGAGQLAESLLQTNTAMERLQGLRARGSEGLSMQLELASAHLILAWNYEQLNETEQALSNLDQAREGLASIVNQRSDNTIATLTVEVLITQGEFLQAQGETEAALDAYREAEAIVDRQFPINRNLLIQDMLVRLYRLTGRTGEADGLQEVLETNGYVPVRAWSP